MEVPRPSSALSKASKVSKASAASPFKSAARQKQKTIGKYNISRTLGSGASCKVKLGLDTESQKKVAVKILKTNIGDDELEFIKDEVDALKKMKQHKHIVELLDDDSGMYERPGRKSKRVNYLVLEFCSGGMLFDYIESTGRFEEPLARFYYKQLLSGIDHAHKNGIAHRDLKPENIMLS